MGGWPQRGGASLPRLDTSARRACRGGPFFGRGGGGRGAGIGRVRNYSYGIVLPMCSPNKLFGSRCRTPETTLSMKAFAVFLFDLWSNALGKPPPPKPCWSSNSSIDGWALFDAASCRLIGYSGHTNPHIQKTWQLRRSALASRDVADLIDAATEAPQKSG